MIQATDGRRRSSDDVVAVPLPSDDFNDRVLIVAADTTSNEIKRVPQDMIQLDLNLLTWNCPRLYGDECDQVADDFTKKVSEHSSEFSANTIRPKEVVLRYISVRSINRCGR